MKEESSSSEDEEDEEEEEEQEEDASSEEEEVRSSAPRWSSRPGSLQSPVCLFDRASAFLCAGGSGAVPRGEGELPAAALQVHGGPR